MEKTEKINSTRISRAKLIDIVLVATIILWPFVNSFLGIDMVDTGYYLYQYDNPLSPEIPYTAYLATMIGSIWLKIFPKLGLWGLNLLEVLMEYVLCFFVYKMLKKYFGKRETLVGILVCMLLINTYVNIFNYHQLNMFFCTMLAILMAIGLDKNKNLYVFLAGCAGMLAVAARMPSVLTIICVIAPIYWGIVYRKSIKEVVVKMVWYVAGYVPVVIGYGVVLVLVNKHQKVIDEVLRLGRLSTGSTGSYSSGSMIDSFIEDTINGSLAAVCFAIVTVILLVLTEKVWVQRKATSKKWRSISAYALVCVICVAAWIYVVTEIADAPDFIQLTSMSWFIYGILFAVALVFVVIALFVEDDTLKRDGLFMFMSEALVLLCFVGSNARAKHAIMGMWIFIPFIIHKCVELVKSGQMIDIRGRMTISSKAIKNTLIIMTTFMVVMIGVFVAVTNNFDSTNRLELNAGIDSDKLVYLKTTERQAKYVNEVLDVVHELRNDDTTLMVVGNPIMFYYLTGMRAYVKPWVTGSSYTAWDFSQNLIGNEEQSVAMPIIIVAKTDVYKGFAEEDYSQLRKENSTNNYGEKGEFVDAFIGRNGYDLRFENEYFEVYFHY